MKIVHIAPNAPYNEGWGYQENLLPKYQKKLGHDVVLIVPNLTHKDGKVVETGVEDYVSSDGIRVIRLQRKKYSHRVLTKLRARLEVYPLLKELRPDFVFFHGLVSTTIFDVVKYKKELAPQCVIVQDNHLDYNIGTRCRSAKEKLIRGYYRRMNRRSIRYVDRVYGVTPWRQTYARDYFRIPPEKTGVLIMGADDEKIDLTHRREIRQKLRGEYGISEEDFLIVTGGKIDQKKQIHHLMEACRDLSNVKLLVFGQVAEDVRPDFDRARKDNDNVRYIGWLDADRVYDYFLAAELVFFPGQHSVLWEQACACKVPCVFSKWEGMAHVDNGGNSDFILSTDRESIAEKILQLRFTPKYHSMKAVALSDATDIYMYSEIAKKSLECADLK